MADEQHSAESPDDQPIPAGQRWFDNIFLLLILSILISGLIYNAWGLIELFARR